MVEKVMYECEKCKKAFDSGIRCLEHEKMCGLETFICQCCGEHKVFKETDFFEKNLNHSINLGRFGYGSELENKDVEFDVCDSCLSSWLHCFAIRPDFLIEDDEVNYYDE